MIFRQWQQVLSGQKTMTRRLCQEKERCLDGFSVAKTWTHNVLGTTGHRAWCPYYPKWQIGCTYAVQPGRGHPAIWIGPDDTPYDAPLAEYLRKASGIDAPRWGWGKHVKKWLREHGYREARIRITGIRRERIQDISEEDARAEGARIPMIVTATGRMPLNYRAGFEILWDSIHKKHGTRQADNPGVWVLEFETVAQEAEA